MKKSVFCRSVAALLVVSWQAFGAGQYHTADKDHNNAISLAEVLRVIQFYNAGGYHCAVGTEDGYAPGPGNAGCAFHDADQNGDWVISLAELLRVVQFYNSGHLVPCSDGEDGFVPGEICGTPQMIQRELFVQITPNLQAGEVRPNPVPISENDDHSWFYADGTTVYLTAIPAPGYRFVGWHHIEIAPGGDRTVAWINMWADHTDVEAVFAPITSEGEGEQALTAAWYSAIPDYQDLYLGLTRDVFGVTLSATQGAPHFVTSFGVHFSERPWLVFSEVELRDGDTGDVVASKTISSAADAVEVSVGSDYVVPLDNFLYPIGAGTTHHLIVSVAVLNSSNYIVGQEIAVTVPEGEIVGFTPNGTGTGTPEETGLPGFYVKTGNPPQITGGGPQTGQYVSILTINPTASLSVDDPSCIGSCSWTYVSRDDSFVVSFNDAIGKAVLDFYVFLHSAVGTPVFNWWIIEDGNITYSGTGDNSDQDPHAFWINFHGEFVVPNRTYSLVIRYFDQYDVTQTSYVQVTYHIIVPDNTGGGIG